MKVYFTIFSESLISSLCCCAPTKMGAENKFWNTPDLVRELVPFLDLASILNLASVHDITLALIYHNSAWRRTIWSDLLRRTSFHLGDEEVKNAVKVMKLAEDKEVLLLDLLDTICERFPATQMTPLMRILPRTR